LPALRGRQRKKRRKPQGERGKYRAIDDFRVARRFKQKRLQNLK
jgi:hypothetical protein